METPTNSPTPVQSGPRRFDPLAIGIVVAGILMMLLAVALLFPALTFPVRTIVSTHLVSKNIPGAQFLSDEPNQTTTYTEKDGSYVGGPPDGLIVSLKVTPEHTTKIVRVADGSYELRDGDYVLHTSAASLVGVDRSPDGMYVLYAEQATSSQPAFITGASMSSLTINPNEWVVWMYDIAANMKFRIGTGVHPFFVGNEYVVRTAPIGVFVTDLQTNTDRNVMEKSFARVSMTQLVSPDHKLMGIAETKSSDITVYQVTPTALNEVATLPLVHRLTSYTLGNDGLYTLRIGEFGIEVWHQSLKEDSSGNVILTLPITLRITRLVLSQ